MRRVVALGSLLFALTIDLPRPLAAQIEAIPRLSPAGMHTLDVGQTCASIAQSYDARDVKPGPDLDECEAILHPLLEELSPYERHSVASLLFRLYPCFGFGKHKDRLVLQALEAADELNAPEAAIVALFNRGVCAWNDHDLARALDSFAPFGKALRGRLLLNPTDDPDQLIADARSFQEYTRRYIRFLENAWRRRPDACGRLESGCIEEAWAITQSLKSRLFHARHISLYANTDRSRTLSELLRRRNALAYEVALNEAGITTLTDSLNKTPLQIKEMLSELEKQIASRFPNLSRMERGLQPGILDVQQMLRPGEVFVSYVFPEVPSRKPIAFVVRGEGRPMLIQLPLVSRHIRALGEALRARIVSGATTPEVTPLARRLRAVLLEPLGTRRTERLIVAVDDALANMPFPFIRSAGLPEGATAAVSLVPSGSVFVSIRKRKQKQSEATGPTESYVGFGLTEFSDSGLDPLPFVAQELERAATNGAFSSGTHINGRARESEIYANSALVTQAMVVHFATHTAVLEGELAFVFAPGEGEDGYLTEHEIIANLDLSARLVLLSGCDTARLDAAIQMPGEAFSSLTRAFFVSGADQILATLWPVEDQAQSIFVSELVGAYRATNSAHQALNIATQHMRTRSEIPFYWAGNVLIGD